MIFEWSFIKIMGMCPIFESSMSRKGPVGGEGMLALVEDLSKDVNPH